MYYLTIEKNDEKICDRQLFADYSLAIAACATYYKPKTKRSVLTFTTEVINGKFARSYVELNRPENIKLDSEIGKQQYAIAAKFTNAFDYTDSYFFLIESEIGVKDAEGI